MTLPNTREILRLSFKSRFLFKIPSPLSPQCFFDYTVLQEFCKAPSSTAGSLTVK